MTEEPKVDGRRKRGLTTRDAILDGCRSLMVLGVFRPSMAAIAKVAGYSVRSGFEHYGSIEEVYREALKDESCANRVLAHAVGSYADTIMLPEVVRLRIIAAVVLGQRAEMPT